MASHAQSLIELLDRSVAERPNGVAVEKLPSHAITYRDLAILVSAVSERLIAMGVRPGDPVGINARKSIDAYAAMRGHANGRGLRPGRCGGAAVVELAGATDACDHLRSFTIRRKYMT